MKKKRMASRSGWAQTVAFATTESRNLESVIDKEGVPGPNSYQPKVTIADRLPKPNKKSGPFGSKEEV